MHVNDSMYYNTGGICGGSYSNSTIKNCVALGMFDMNNSSPDGSTGPASNNGGIVGFFGSGSAVTRCFFSDPAYNNGHGTLYVDDSPLGDTFPVASIILNKYIFENGKDWVKVKLYPTATKWATFPVHYLVIDSEGYTISITYVPISNEYALYDFSGGVTALFTTLNNAPGTIISPPPECTTIIHEG